MPAVANKAYRYRIYPTEEQKTLFMKTFGCCRKVWNLMLSDKIKQYKADGTMLHNTPAMYKDEYPYLGEVDSLALANVQLNLQSAYKSFFDKPKTGFPKFKSRRRSRFSYTTNNQNGTVRIIDDRYVHLPKIGDVKAVFHRDVPEGYTLRSATVSMEHDGTFYCSLLYKYEEDIVPVEHPELNAIGFDYKSDGFFTDSNGHTHGSPKYYRKSQKRLAKAQKSLSRKKGSRKGEPESNNHKKQKAKVAKIHRHVANQRVDHLHKLSTEIANQYDLVAVEDLDMKAMSNKGSRKGKATLDNGYGMFLRFLEYKLHDRGKVFVKVDRWYPSSQLCSCCGYRNPEVKDLLVKAWTCPDCHTVHDRDHNAAVNVLNEGLRTFLKDTARQ